MNCETCISQKVCFLQKQIESLAERVTYSLTHRTVPDGDRTKAMARRSERLAEKDVKICHELRGVTASNCSYFNSIDIESDNINPTLERKAKHGPHSSTQN